MESDTSKTINTKTPHMQTDLIVSCSTFPTGSHPSSLSQEAMSPCSLCNKPKGEKVSVLARWTLVELAPFCKLWSQEHLAGKALLRKPDHRWDNLIIDFNHFPNIDFGVFCWSDLILQNPIFWNMLYLYVGYITIEVSSWIRKFPSTYHQEAALIPLHLKIYNRHRLKENPKNCDLTSFKNLVVKLKLSSPLI